MINYKDFNFTRVKLNAGPQVLRLVAEERGTAIDKIMICGILTIKTDNENEPQP